MNSYFETVGVNAIPKVLPREHECCVSNGLGIGMWTSEEPFWLSQAGAEEFYTLAICNILALGCVIHFSQNIDELRRKKPLGNRVRGQHYEILGGRYRTSEENGYIGKRGIPTARPRRKRSPRKIRASASCA